MAELLRLFLTRIGWDDVFGNSEQLSRRSTNPSLPGFHPDASIVRAGDNCYIATSTFNGFAASRYFTVATYSNWSSAEIFVLWYNSK
jgi:beta-xylosidase